MLSMHSGRTRNPPISRSRRPRYILKNGAGSRLVAAISENSAEGKPFAIRQITLNRQFRGEREHRPHPARTRNRQHIGDGKPTSTRRRVNLASTPSPSIAPISWTRSDQQNRGIVVYAIRKRSGGLFRGSDEISSRQSGEAGSAPPVFFVFLRQRTLRIFNWPDVTSQGWN